MNFSTPGFPVPHHLPELAETHVHWVSDVIQPSHPLSSPSPSAFNLFHHQGLFQWVSFHIRWPKYCSFRFSISLFLEYSGLISFRIDWFDLLAVQGTLKSILQHHSSKASILQHSAFFMVQPLHPCVTTGKTIDLTIQSFVRKLMSLPFHYATRFVTGFLPRSKCLLISWLQSKRLEHAWMMFILFQRKGTWDCIANCMWPFIISFYSFEKFKLISFEMWILIFLPGSSLSLCNSD